MPCIKIPEYVNIQSYILKLIPRVTKNQSKGKLIIPRWSWKINRKKIYENHVHQKHHQIVDVIHHSVAWPSICRKLSVSLCCVILKTIFHRRCELYIRIELFWYIDSHIYTYMCTSSTSKYALTLHWQRWWLVDSYKSHLKW